MARKKVTKKKRSTNNEVSPVLALAEAAATRDEVLAIIEPMAKEAFVREARKGRSVRRIRDTISFILNYYLDTHYFSFEGFGRKKTVDRIIKRLLKGYQKKHRRIEQETRRIINRIRKEGSAINMQLAREEAVRVFLPELFENEDES